jgi:hypothetical protein
MSDTKAMATIARAFKLVEECEDPDEVFELGLSILAMGIVMTSHTNPGFAEWLITNHIPQALRSAPGFRRV